MGAAPPNKVLQRAGKSLIGLTLAAIWRHTHAARTEPVSALAGR
jgi:hypothetical protein